MDNFLVIVIGCDIGGLYVDWCVEVYMFGVIYVLFVVIMIIGLNLV